MAIADLNKCLTVLGLESVDNKKISTEKYKEELVKKVKDKLSQKFSRACKSDVSLWDSDCEEMINQLKEAFHKSEDYGFKIKILSVLPHSWSISKIQETFNAPVSIVRRMKTLVNQQGLLPSRQPRVRQGLSVKVQEEILQFYHENSRMMPGKKDVISVKKDGVRTLVQKELLLMNLTELYSAFLEKYPDSQVSFSKFADLRPKECVLAGASGTHSVCVCIYHENFSLMIESAQLVKVVDGKDKPMSLSDVLALSICDIKSVDCYLGNCVNCPGVLPIQELLETTFDERMITEVKLKQWVTVDRCALETCVKDCDEFIETFTSSVPKILEHHFLAQAQAKFQSELKSELKDDEVMVLGDFSENYNPVIQDAIQGVHWQKDLITIHPFVCYYKKNGTTTVFNLAVISDYLEHNSLAVFTFQHRLVKHLKEKIPNLKKVFYVSDGSASQYKNRQNARNLRMHFFDFGVLAEWHFSASCHGKGPHDGVGACLKRECSKESLRRVGQESITTAQQFYEWASIKFQKSITVELVTKEDINVIRQKFEERFKDTPPVEGISSCHCIIPLSENVLMMKMYSASKNCAYVYFGALMKPVYDDLHGFIIISTPNSWELAFVYDRHESKETLEILQLESATTGRKEFKFAESDDPRTISLEDVITVTNVVPDVNKFKLPRKTITYANTIQAQR